MTYSHAMLPLPALTGLSAVVFALERGLFRGYDVGLTTLPLAVAAILVGIVLVVLAMWPVLRWLWRQVAAPGDGTAEHRRAAPRETARPAGTSPGRMLWRRLRLRPPHNR